MSDLPNDTPLLSMLDNAARHCNIAHFAKLFAESAADIRRRSSESEELAVQLNKARDALRKYGSHLYECEAVDINGNEVDRSACTCGFGPIFDGTTDSSSDEVPIP